MSKVLFLNGNVHGHINPTIPLVKELVKNGEEVSYFSTAGFKEKIEAAGASFVDYGSELSRFFDGFRPRGSHPFYTLVEFMLGMDRVVIPLVIEKTAGMKFDYVIHDAMFGGGNVVAKKLGLPAVCTCTSFAMNKLPMPAHMFEPGFHPQLDMLYKDIEKTSEEWEIKDFDIMDIFFKRESLNIVFTSRMFQPEERSFDDSFKFVGPSIADREEGISFPFDELQEHKVVYISMGTINNNCLEFYEKCIEALEDPDFKVVMSIGKKVDMASMREIPDNFIVKDYVPQIEVLKKADVFISHGGLNSISEALYYGVPVVAVPQVNDQHMVTRRLVELGAGIVLKMDEITPQLLKESVDKVLSDNGYKTESERIGASFKEAGGYRTAAHHVLEFKNKLR